MTKRTCAGQMVAITAVALVSFALGACGPANAKQRAQKRDAERINRTVSVFPSVYRKVSILGTVKSEAGSALEGVLVVASNINTGLNQSATTLRKGEYAIVEVPPGEYEICASKPSFQTKCEATEGLFQSDRSGIPINRYRTINFRLKLSKRK